MAYKTNATETLSPIHLNSKRALRRASKSKIKKLQKWVDGNKLNELAGKKIKAPHQV